MSSSLFCLSDIKWGQEHLRSPKMNHQPTKKGIAAGLKKTGKSLKEVKEEKIVVPILGSSGRVRDEEALLPIEVTA